MKPSDEEALLAGLRALREKVSEDGPPASVEAALVSAFRRRELRNKANSRRKPLLWLGLAAAATVLIAVVVNRQDPPVVQTKVPPKPTVTAAARAPEYTTEASPAPSAPVRRKVPRAAPQPVPVEEVATDFMALPYAPRFTSEDRGQVVRVRLPRESMRVFGLPVNQDRIVNAVKADVLVGEDGIARAIRFVQ
jgi:hypothetical protein